VRRPGRGLGRLWPRLGLLGLVALQACVFVPRTVQTYDEDCQMVTRQAVLEVQAIGLFQQCNSDGCRAALVAAGVVSAVTAVVSGSLVVVGNVVYWIEKQGQCRRAN
jgi:hypothetical protein